MVKLTTRPISPKSRYVPSRSKARGKKKWGGGTVLKSRKPRGKKKLQDNLRESKRKVEIDKLRTTGTEERK